jgi:hypothetical protein
MFTYRYDNFRSGHNPHETVLTPSNVNTNQFGKLFSYAVDGQTMTSPLYVANVIIAGRGAHNVVYVATSHDSVYAFDADGLVTTPLWHTSFIDPAGGITTEPAEDAKDSNDSGDVEAEHGITGTPVIDQSTGTLYVAAKTTEVLNGSTRYAYRLHALDIASGTERFGGPTTIQASGFVPLTENQRPALLLANGVVYVGFGSAHDNLPWHGWILGYDGTTLEQVVTYNATSPASFGGSGDDMVVFNENIYYGAAQDSIKAFQLSNGFLTTTPVSQSAATYGYPGAAMTISANGTIDGILWAVERPGVLHAYDATDLTHELYNSNQANGSRDVPATAARFNPPLVANGRVYVASQAGQLTVYGLLP